MAAAKVPDSAGSSVRSCRCRVVYGRSQWKRAAQGAGLRIAFVLILFCQLLCTGASRPSPSEHQTRTTAKAAADATTHATGSQQQFGTGPVLASEPDVVTAPTQSSTSSSTAPRGRSLKQITNDPYGYGYYDPYTAGVTPGFVNVDVNRETGLHMDVGQVAVDMSADKNYVGLGVGTLLGVGAARDRGWNLQLGNGQVLDASVTKDAGLGLWLLDGLVNVNIGPEGIFKKARPGNVAARTTDAATPVQVQSVTVDDTPLQTAALQQQQQVYLADHAGSNPGIPEATVDDPAAVVAHQQQQQQQNISDATEVNPPMYTTGTSEVNQMNTQDPSNYSSSPQAAAAQAESQLPSYDFMDLLAYDPAADTIVANAATSRSRLAAPTPPAQSLHTDQAYQTTGPQAYSGLAASTAAGSAAAAAAGAAAGATYPSHLVARPAAPPPPPPAAAAADRSVTAPPPASSSYPSYMVSRPAATGTEHDDAWTVASQYSDTQQMATARLAAMTAAPRPSSHSSVLQQPQGLSTASSDYSTKPPQQQWQYQQQPNWFQPQQQQQQPTMSQATYGGGSEGSSGIQNSNSPPRRACDGGVQVWVTGSKFKCKYKKAEPELSAVPAGPVKVASEQYTYSNGVAV